jgi:hypothetical protein
VAYDLFFRTVVPKNIALLSSVVDTRALSADPTPTTESDKQYLAQLAVVKMQADGGNKKALKDWKAALNRKAQKDWKAVLKKISDMRANSKKGDKAAARTLAVLKESGLFEGVSAMTVSGNDGRLSHKASKLLTMIVRVRDRANQGDPRAVSLIEAIRGYVL